MKEWTELYRDMLSAYNALAEAIATAKTLHERDTRRIAELEAELAALKAGEWRPVTEAPDADMDVEMIVIGMYKSDDNVFWDEYFGAMVDPTHWRPAPPQE